MFNQQKYINSFIKENYKTIKLRIRYDDKLVINKLSETDNVNKYLISLILKDVYENPSYHFLNDDVEIDFSLSPVMKKLVDKAEDADLLNDYGLYMNIAYAIDSQAKKETKQHVITESQWNKLTRRYCLWNK